MHEVAKENGAYGEYAVAPAYLTFHVPHHVPFEEAATVPTSGLTTALALFSDLRFPPPWASQSDREKWQRVPFLIYGVTTSVGAFAAQLARLVGFQVIIGVAGRAQAFASALVNHAIDYRNGEDALVNQVEAILKKEGLGSKVPYIFDAISENGSLETCLRIIAPDGWISTMLPPQIFALDPENFKYPARVTSINTAVPQVFSTHKDFAYLWLRYFGKLMENGRFKGHPHQVVPGGLDGVLTGLESLRDGKASGFKYVFKIHETSFSNGARIYRSNSSL
jgi:NADPH:quinone reductase-like Zn-dependent oxidoreductase